MQANQISKELLEALLSKHSQGECAKILNTWYTTIRRLRLKYGLSINPEACERARAAGGRKGNEKSRHIDRKGLLNPNWKNGISKNHYHYKKIQKKRYPEKIRAREKVHHAVRSGKLIKKKCFCGSANVFAHHEDYSKPLDVVWLCRKHHREIHDNKH